MFGAFTGFLLCTTCAAVLYGLTTSTTVGGGDSGELMVVAHELGVAHPPGYPSFVLLTKLFEVLYLRILPHVSVPAAINYANVTFASLAVGFMFLACFWATHRHSWAASVIAALVFATAPAVWRYSIVTEVFALNNMFVASVLALLARYEVFLSTAVGDGDGITTVKRMAKPRNSNIKPATTTTTGTGTGTTPPIVFILLSVFVCGLSTTNQHTVVLLLVPMVMWVMVVEAVVARRLTPARFLLYTAVFLLGMSPYLFMMASPVIKDSRNSWGTTHMFDGFVQHFLRRDYGTFSLANSKMSYAQRDVALAWVSWAKNLLVQYNHGATLPIMGMGVVAVLRQAVAERRVTMLAALLASWVLYLVFFNGLNNLPITDPLFLGVLERFWIQPLASSTLFLAVGLSWITKLITKKMSATSSTAVVIVAALALLCSHVRREMPIQDQSVNVYVSEFGRAMLEPLPHDAILVVKGDIVTNAARYSQCLEHVRPDVSLVDLEMMRGDWYIGRVKGFIPGVVFPGKSYSPGPGNFDALRFIEANLRSGRRRLFIAYEFVKGDTAWQSKYMKVAHSIADEVVPLRKALLPPLDDLRHQLTELSAFPTPDRFPALPADESKYGKETWEQVIRGDYWAVHHRVGIMLVKPALLGGEEVSLAVADNNPYYVALKAGIKRFEYVMDEQRSTAPHRTMCLTAKYYGLALNELTRFENRMSREQEKGVKSEIVRAFTIYLKFVEDTKEGAGETRLLKDLRTAIKRYTKEISEL